jgi:hypothetical protein
MSMAKRGSRVEIDLAELERLCAIQATDEEIAAWFKVTTRTIERRRKEPEFGAVMERGKAKGRISVRRMQMKLLEQGNATMGVWLGKQLLGQTDQVLHEVHGSVSTVIMLPGGGGRQARGIECDPGRDDLVIDISLNEKSIDVTCIQAPDE